MHDLFDEFMDELRKRQAGQQPAADSDDQAEGSESGAEQEADLKAGRAGSDRAETDAAPDASDDDASEPAADTADADEDESPEEPSPIWERSSSAGGGRSGGRPPRRPRSGVGGPNDGGSLGERIRTTGRTIVIVAVVVVVLFLITIAGNLLDLWTDAIWYRSVGFSAVFWTRLTAQGVLFAGTLVAVLVILLVNVWLAARLSPPPDPSTPSAIRSFLNRMSEAGSSFEDRSPFGGPFGGGMGSRGLGRDRYRPFESDAAGRARRGGGQTIEFEDFPDLGPIGVWLIVAFCVLLALGVAASVSGSWETILLWQHQTTFSTDAAHPVTDPIFNRDIGFFLFQLPFLRLVQGVLNGVLLASLLVAGVRYALSAARSGFSLTTPIRLHLAVLGGLYLLSVAVGYQLDKFELVYSTQGALGISGVSYTDANARFLALDVLTAIAALAGALLVGGAFTRMMWPLGLAVGVWLLAAVVLGGLYPQFVQRFTVEPNQFAEEQPYIANNISMTRLAYQLDPWSTKDYSGDKALTESTLNAEAATFQNARLWDYRPLGATLDQIQTVRQYYDFYDVDTDRYMINGVERQVMLSARELAQDKTDASSWVNQRLTYTHGIGLAMVPVNAVTPEGLPQLLIRDLPPVSTGGAPTISQPRIYFGERPSTYVVVDAKQPEFDYPQGGSAGTTQAQKTSWTGKTGIRLDSTLTRLLFAARFRDLNLLISDQVTSDSQLLMHRSLNDRLQLIAPFLKYDKDPYVVVGTDGALYYIQDAYTYSDRFPNAEPFNPGQLGAGSGLAGAPFNYIRNSVKVVMNAYTGKMTFYAADPSDPILRAYEGVFPTLFHPLDEMPDGLRAHLRVPEELFNVQTRMYATYHVTDPETFYRQNDLWTVPTESGSQQSLPTEAYYVMMRMPGEPSAEFLLLQPMLPKNRPNMIAWVAARMDAPNYGQVRVYQFPQDTSVRGPNQIEAQIDADPTISAQISLWNQSGSKVIRGNLIVVPVQDSIVYLQPVYLQSTSAAFPAFEKIVVATSSRIVWGDTLTQALQALVAGGGTSVPTPSPGPTGSPGASPGVSPMPASSGAAPSPPAGDVASLIAYANAHFEAAQAALRAGDFARYGQEIDAVKAALAQLRLLVPTPGPGASGGAPSSSP